jgi:hypothetical protein
MSIWKIALGVIVGLIILRFIPYIIAGCVFAVASLIALVMVIFTPKSKPFIVRTETTN